jgi:hypothetical protein
MNKFELFRKKKFEGKKLDLFYPVSKFCKNENNSIDEKCLKTKPRNDKIRFL